MLSHEDRGAIIYEGFGLKQNSSRILRKVRLYGCLPTYSLRLELRNSLMCLWEILQSHDRDNLVKSLPQKILLRGLWKIV